MDSKFLILLGMFVSTLLLIQGAYYYYLSVKGIPEEKINRRLVMHCGNFSNEQVMSILRREQDGHIATRFKNLLPRLDNLITQSGLTISTFQISMIMLLLGFATFIISTLLLGIHGLSSVAIGVVVGAAIPLFYLKFKARLRMRHFSRQLPDALDLIVRSLKAGHPINAAMSLVANEMADPIGSEFGLVVDEMTYGNDLREALTNLAERVRHPDIRYMVVTIEIQHATGGNLAEVLEGLAAIMRGRVRMFARIRSLSAEGRFSAYIVSALPFIVFLGLSVLSPKYFLGVSNDDLYWPMLIGALCQLMMGNYIMFKLVNFKV
ncbi:MAG: type II secretion system F family protein [Sneathiella sp.]|uniref:type II secretion system F family protein n=1 Tax=Sneathiella sp. TaxID=1964365 RepID=UPI0030033197